MFAEGDRKSRIVNVGMVLRAVIGLIDADGHVRQPHLARNNGSVKIMPLHFVLFVVEDERFCGKMLPLIALAAAIFNYRRGVA